MEPKVVIGVPHLGNLPQFFVSSVLNLRDSVYAYAFVENEPVDIARNKIVETFLETEGTHLLFLDADMKFPQLTVRQLLAAEKDIVSGVYFARTDTPVPHVYRYNRTDHDGTLWYATLGPEMIDWLRRHPEHNDRTNVHIYGDPELVPCDAVGAGCLMIRREVLEDVYAANSDSYYPWFENRPGSKGGEDFAFCKRATDLGYSIWADFNLQCDHEAKGSFTGREEFAACFAVGTEDEHDFSQPMLVEIGPAGNRKLRPNPGVRA